MIRFRRLLTLSLFVFMSSSIGMAQDFTRYRDFQFGMSPDAVATQMHINPSEIRTTYRRPAVIQTVQWDKPGYSESGTKDKSIRSIRFDFYNGELSKMVVTYDPAATGGLTTDDMIEAISALFGPATRPDRTIGVSALYQDNRTVLAAWDDEQYSYNLFRATYGNTFGLVAFSKRLDLMATVSIREADRLETLEAPQRARSQQLKQEADKRAAEEKARLVNKPSFRP
jgi:hypothetical protein